MLKNDYLERMRPYQNVFSDSFKSEYILRLSGLAFGTFGFAERHIFAERYTKFSASVIYMQNTHFIVAVVIIWNTRVS